MAFSNRNTVLLTLIPLLFLRIFSCLLQPWDFVWILNSHFSGATYNFLRNGMKCEGKWSLRELPLCCVWSGLCCSLLWRVLGSLRSRKMDVASAVFIPALQALCREPSPHWSLGNIPAQGRFFHRCTTPALHTKVPKPEGHSAIRGLYCPPPLWLELGAPFGTCRWKLCEDAVE